MTWGGFAAADFMVKSLELSRRFGSHPAAGGIMAYLKSALAMTSPLSGL
jgi:hypothetical protein